MCIEGFRLTHSNIEASNCLGEPNNDKANISSEISKSAMDILNCDTCPNCDSKIENYKCTNCDYLSWNIYNTSLDKTTKEENKKERSDNYHIECFNKKWCWKRYDLSVLNWKEFTFYNIYWNISTTKALLKIKYKWKIYKVEAEYIISKEHDYNDDNFQNIIHLKWIKINPNIKVFINWKNWVKWKWIINSYHYNITIDIIYTILNDTRFNPHLEIKQKDI